MGKRDVFSEMEGLEGIISRADMMKALLIPALHAIQKEQGFLPARNLQGLSRKLGIPLVEVYSVASFYHQFYFSPRGRKIVRVCTGTACHVRGASKVLNTLQEHFGIKEGDTTEDLAMTLETVGCVGCCGLAPVVTVNEDVTGEVEQEKVRALINSIEGQ